MDLMVWPASTEQPGADASHTEQRCTCQSDPPSEEGRNQLSVVQNAQPTALCVLHNGILEFPTVAIKATNKIKNNSCTNENKSDRHCTCLTKSGGKTQKTEGGHCSVSFHGNRQRASAWFMEHGCTGKWCLVSWVTL